MTLADFLLARIAEDEAFWSAEHNPVFGVTDDFVIGNQDVDLRVRMLAECEAKRRIVALHGVVEWPIPDGVRRACTTCGDHEDDPVVPWPCDTLLALALLYADHPDFREEWRERG